MYSKCIVLNRIEWTWDDIVMKSNEKRRETLRRPGGRCCPGREIGLCLSKARRCSGRWGERFNCISARYLHRKSIQSQSNRLKSTKIHWFRRVRLEKSSFEVVSCLFGSLWSSRWRDVLRSLKSSAAKGLGLIKWLREAGRSLRMRHSVCFVALQV